MECDFIEFIKTASSDNLKKAINLLIGNNQDEEMTELITKLKKLI